MAARDLQQRKEKTCRKNELAKAEPAKAEKKPEPAKADQEKSLARLRKQSDHGPFPRALA